MWFIFYNFTGYGVPVELENESTAHESENPLVGVQQNKPKQVTPNQTHNHISEGTSSPDLKKKEGFLLTDIVLYPVKSCGGFKVHCTEYYIMY